MLKNDFIPVAIDQWYQRQQKDAEGDFYRKIAGQGPRKEFSGTTQGRYICSPDGTLLGYNNNRGPERIGELMKSALANFDPNSFDSLDPLGSTTPDPEYHLQSPADGLILRVHSKVLDGYTPTNEWTSVFHGATGRDNVWITAEEKRELAQCIRDGGDLPAMIAHRIARFHLVDNTRGEPPRWANSEIRSLGISIDKQGIISGKVWLETKDGKRGFTAQLLGFAKAEGDSITRFDFVAKGDFWGSGRYTHFAPVGKFTLAIDFRIADGTDPSDSIAPHGSKGWVEGYFESLK